MMIDFQQYPVTVIVCPVDMRCGYQRLCELARLAGIDVDAGGQFVVFVNKTRGLCRILFADKHGTTVICRRLRAGRFERLLARTDGPSLARLTVADLENFLNGRSIFEKKISLW